MEWNQFLLCDAADLMREVEDKSVDLIFSSLPDISQTHYKSAIVTFANCPQCSSTKMPHRACPNCGYYRGRPVLSATE